MKPDLSTEIAKVLKRYYDANKGTNSTEAVNDMLGALKEVHFDIQFRAEEFFDRLGDVSK